MTKSSHTGSDTSLVIDNRLSALRRYTDARIGLGRSGVSLPTQAQLAFQLAHARARDAVHIPLDIEALRHSLDVQHDAVLWLHSQVKDRVEYLQRPDLGRCLDAQSVERLKSICKPSDGFDVAIVIADGLSSTAVQSHGAVTAKLILSQLQTIKLTVAPLCLVEQGRVAIGDEIGQLLQSRLLILMIGERPGLSSPDSLGIYYTYQPRIGLTDEARNCISNIRPGGLLPAQAVQRLTWLIAESEKLKLSGVNLKDRSDESDKAVIQHSNFLLE